jgi:hypothetical protein
LWSDSVAAVGTESISAPRRSNFLFLSGDFLSVFLQAGSLTLGKEDRLRVPRRMFELETAEATGGA